MKRVRKKTNCSSSDESLLSLSISQIDGWIWAGEVPDPKSGGLAREVYDLRNVPIGELSVDQVLFLISQQRACQALVPLAIDWLESDPLKEVEYYPGDLLSNVLSLPSEFWEKNPVLASKMRECARRAIPLIDEEYKIDKVPLFRSVSKAPLHVMLSVLGMRLSMWIPWSRFNRMAKETPQRLHGQIQEFLVSSEGSI